MIAINKYPDFHLISNFELEMVGYDDNDEVTLIGTQILYTHQFNEIGWTIYQRYDPELADFHGADALADCTNKKEAYLLFRHWTDVLDKLSAINDVTKQLRQ